MKIIYAIGALLLLTTGCEETITIDVDKSGPAVVIEGEVTNQPGMQYVRIRQSVDFYSSANPLPVKDAIVTVSNQKGEITTFTHNPHSNKDSLGYYWPTTLFKGIEGDQYHLTVRIGDQTYEADDQLNRIYPIQQIRYEIDPEAKNPEIPGRIYQVLVDLIEPKETEDYYLLKFYRNGYLQLDDYTDVYVFSDDLIKDRPNGVAMPLNYKSGETARVEFYSLSPQLFTFYNDLQKLLKNDGGMFDPPPSNPRNNLSNGALGYFQASAVAMREIKIP